MGFNIAGGVTGSLQEVETATLAARVTMRPSDPGSLGAYALHIDNGTTVMTAGLAANSPIYSFRWGNSNLCVPRSIRMSVYDMTTAFAAGRMDFAAFFARGFTASDTGGTTATLTGNNCKKRTSFGTTLLTEVRFSQTVTLTAGTRTLDAQPFGRLAVNGLGAAANGNLVLPQSILWQRDTSDEYPLTFAQNEGFVIQASVPATGTWFWNCSVEWAEFASF
jgi:hypothetical protein